MKYRFCIILILLSVSIFAQNIDPVLWINNLAGKKTATFEDAVNMYILTLEKKPAGFARNVKLLEDMKILSKTDNFKKDKPAYRGTVALMIARHLKLRDSLFYRMIRVRRYAFRACIADGIMGYDESEWDKLSGEELIEIMALVSDRMED